MEQNPTALKNSKVPYEFHEQEPVPDDRGIEFTGENVQNVEATLDEYFAEQHHAKGQHRTAQVHRAHGQENEDCGTN